LVGTDLREDAATLEKLNSKKQAVFLAFYRAGENYL